MSIFHWRAFFLIILLQRADSSFGFNDSSNVIGKRIAANPSSDRSSFVDAITGNCRLNAYETEIAFSTLAFASSHIGMSAVRGDIIERIGSLAENIGLVGTGYQLPDFWPGDEAGQEIFPDPDTTGRQLYRILYTIVSFATLGSGFIAYLNSLIDDVPIVVDSSDGSILYYALASLSWGISIASLINPSPLSLVPVYEQGEETDDSSTIKAIRRNDKQKLQAYGMTRITRHPLILPVVPWGISTALIMGGESRDFLFFGILSLYAIAGCAAQDLRVLNEEGSVGTVFNPDSSLQEFFRDTSFIPFQALIDSRQSGRDVLNEVPWFALLFGTVIGFQLQQALVTFLVHYAATN